MQSYDPLTLHTLIAAQDKRKRDLDKTMTQVIGAIATIQTPAELPRRLPASQLPTLTMPLRTTPVR